MKRPLGRAWWLLPFLLLAALIIGPLVAWADTDPIDLTGPDYRWSQTAIVAESPVIAGTPYTATLTVTWHDAPIAQGVLIVIPEYPANRDGLVSLGVAQAVGGTSTFYPFREGVAAIGFPLPADMLTGVAVPLLRIKVTVFGIAEREPYVPPAIYVGETVYQRTIQEGP